MQECWFWRFDAGVLVGFQALDFLVRFSYSVSEGGGRFGYFTGFVVAFPDFQASFGK